jgi:hypothetical protein
MAVAIHQAINVVKSPSIVGEITDPNRSNIQSGKYSYYHQRQADPFDDTICGKIYR